MNEEDRRQVVFLDTNALHYMHLYLTYACNESLYPFCPNDGSADEARQHLARISHQRSIDLKFLSSADSSVFRTV